MFDRLADLQVELEKLEARLSEIYAAGDQDAAREAGRRHAELKPIVEAYEQYRQAESDLVDAREMLGIESDAEMREYLEGEITTKEGVRADLEAQLKELLVPKDPNDGRNVIVEIRGAEGGEEGNLWAGDLFRMYERFAERHRWKVEVLEAQVSEMGGFRDVSFSVKAPEAWARLKYEGGVHRVQRVPATESQGRVHTSAATVVVLPEAEDVDVQID
ncbi:MAG: PCRF domain-containing protein, partial [Actinomycetota bacterium]